LAVCQGYVVSEDGMSKGCFEKLPAEYEGLPVADYSGKLILPGMTDLHLHAPQYAFRGTAMDLELLDWLNTYTYPEEAKYGDLDYARKAYGILVKDLLESPTTRACIFASLHTEGTLLLMELLEDAGLPAYVGKLNMNRNAPENYCELSTKAGMEETERWLAECEKKGFTKVRPILTPRFTPSVTDDYMEALGQLAKEKGLPVQSHLSENLGEIAWVKELCPDAVHYGDTYDRFSLFGSENPALMAHCIYSSQEEVDLMKANDVFIAHCPTSNENVIAGIAPASKYLHEGLSIGLGSDIAGGHTLDLFKVMASAVQVSKLYWRYLDQAEPPLSIAEVFWMATVGGGGFFGKVGSFLPGYQFDAIVIDDAFLETTRTLSPEERLERFVYLGNGKVMSKFVEGRQIFG
ncbi:MAG: amidohydrolase family protein, partial [Anaerovoracaceae bacterium]